MTATNFAELQALREAHTEWNTNGKNRHFQRIWLKTLDAIVTALELPNDDWTPFPGRDPSPKLIWDFVDYALWFAEGTIELRLAEEESRRPYTLRVALVRDTRDLYNETKAYWSISLAPGSNAEKDFEVIGKALPESNEPIDGEFLASLRKFLLE